MAAISIPPASSAVTTGESSASRRTRSPMAIAWLPALTKAPQEPSARAGWTATSPTWTCRSRRGQPKRWTPPGRSLPAVPKTPSTIFQVESAASWAQRESAVRNATARAREAVLSFTFLPPLLVVFGLRALPPRAGGALRQGPPEGLIEVVEQSEAAVEAVQVLGVGERQAIDELQDAGRIGAAELRIFQIDVVDDLGDLGDPWIAQFETRDQGLERAAIPLVGELAPDGVEPHLARRRLGALRIGEAEARRGIDEATDEPGRGTPRRRPPPPPRRSTGSPRRCSPSAARRRPSS